MAVIDNIATDIGDVLIIKTDVPIIGISALVGFVDTIQNETGDRFFTKEFRYSLDTINFSDWTELTDSNLSSVSLVTTDTFIIEFKYTRAGTDNVDELILDDITLTQDFSQSISKDIFGDSVFAQYFEQDNLKVLNWALNVLEKLYKQGIVPKYIERGKGDKDPLTQDRDFIEFWRSISLFFGYLVFLAREFETFKQSKVLAPEYLMEWDTFLCSTEGIDELIDITQNYYREKGDRGSKRMFSISGLSQGELFRLICYNAVDEFILAVNQTKSFGWNIGNSSPMYKGLTKKVEFNKAYEDTIGVFDTSLYPIINGPVPTVPDTAIQNMQFNSVAAGQVKGIGAVEEDKMIVIDPGINYEITFHVKQPVGTGNIFTFGCLAFNQNNFAKNLFNAGTGVVQQNFFTRISMNQPGKTYFVRGILYNKDSDPVTDTTNLGVGNHLRVSSQVRKIIPYIVLDNSLGGVVAPDIINLRTLRINPVSPGRSKGFLNNSKWIDILGKNNNGLFTDQEVTDILRKSFIPYNSSFKVQYL